MIAMLSGRSILVTGNAAAAWAARLADVDYIAAYPITPQTEIVELLSKWVSMGVLKAKFVEFESEHSMLAAAGAASLTGARTFSATSSQGLVYGLENLFAISGWRAPMVLVNVARGIGMPMTLQVEHGDFMSARDTGFIQFNAENCQEALDLILISYRVSEDNRILLPAIVSLDGFYLSFTREPVLLPDVELLKEFLPPYRAEHTLLDSPNPLAYAPTLIDGHSYSYFKYQIHLASIKAKEVFYEATGKFKKLFGRSYKPVEEFMLDGAEYAYVSMGAYTTILKNAVRRFREKGHKVGLLKLTMFRPFPREEVAETLRGLKGVMVFDQSLSPGRGGIMYTEITEALYHLNDRPMVITSFIGGLGGKNLTIDEAKYMLEYTIRCVKTGEKPKRSILLFTENDLDKLNRDMEIAGLKIDRGGGSNE